MKFWALITSVTGCASFLVYSIGCSWCCGNFTLLHPQGMIVAGALWLGALSVVGLIDAAGDPCRGCQRLDAELERTRRALLELKP